MSLTNEAKGGKVFIAFTGCKKMTVKIKLLGSSDQNPGPKGKL